MNGVYLVIVPVIDNIYSQKKRKAISCLLRDAPYPVKYKFSYIRKKAVMNIDPLQRQT